MDDFHTDEREMGSFEMESLEKLIKTLREEDLSRCRVREIL